MSEVMGSNSRREQARETARPAGPVSPFSGGKGPTSMLGGGLEKPRKSRRKSCACFLAASSGLPS
jgi:hypothetical protein